MPNKPDKLDEVVKLMMNCSQVTVSTGAGISAESGVPTFRGKDGLWGKFKAEELATMEAFMASPKIVWEWYNWRRELMAKVKPNPGHYAICRMASLFDDFTLITQNVDNLHRQAGSTDVLELHGNIHRNKCSRCNTIVDIEQDIDPNEIPVCAKCEGPIRPDVVWFGEMLPEDIIAEAFERAERSEIFFSVGTSALVQPAASLPLVAARNGATLVEVNPEQTSLTGVTDFHLRGSAGEILPKLVAGVTEGMAKN